MGTWIVTGATKGLGRALAESLLRKGHHVTFCARTIEAVHATEVELRRQNSAVWGMPGSIDDEPFITTLVKRATTLSNQLDGIILNAASLGSLPLSPVSDLNPEEFQQLLNLNLLGNLRVLKACHPFLESTPNSRVLVLTSDAAQAHYPGWASYGATKAALESLALTYAAENRGVHVYVIDPGDMDTEMHRLAVPDDPGPVCDPKSVAQALSPLCHELTYHTGRWRVRADDTGTMLRRSHQMAKFPSTNLGFWPEPARSPREVQGKSRNDVRQALSAFGSGMVYDSCRHNNQGPGRFPKSPPYYCRRHNRGPRTRNLGMHPKPEWLDHPSGHARHASSTRDRSGDRAS